MKPTFRSGRVGVALILSLLVVASAVAQSPDGVAERARRRAEGLLSKAGDHAMVGRGSEALTAARQAREIYGGLADRQGEAAGHMLMGIAHMAQEEPVLAARELEKSVEIFLEEDDKFSAWLALWMRGELDHREGRSAEAADRFERGLRLLGELRSTPASLRLDGFLLLGEAFGAPVQMVRSLGPMMELVAPLLIQFAAGLTRDSYGAALTELGKLSDAEAELDKALAAARLFGGMLDSRVHAHLGDLRRRQGPARWPEAREHYQKALDGLGSFSALPFAQDARMEVEALDRLAEIDAAAGRFDDALAWNDRSLSRVRQEGDRRREARVLTDRADVLKWATRYPEAKQALEKSHSIAVAIRDRYREALALADLGFVAFLQSDYGSAAQHLEQATGLFRELNEPRVEAALLGQLAEVYFLLGSPEQAQVAIDRAAMLAEKTQFGLAQKVTSALESWRRFQIGKGGSDDVLDAWSALWNSDELREYDLGKFKELASTILPTSEEAGEDGAPLLIADPLRSLGESDLPIFHGMSHFLEGRLAIQRGAYAEARRAWKQAHAEFERMGNRDLASTIAAGIGFTYWRENDSKLAVTWLRQAVAGIEETAAGVHVEELLTSFLGSQRRRIYDLLIEFLVAEGRIEEAFLVSERARAQALLRLVANQRIVVGGGDPELVQQEQRLRARLTEWEFELGDQRQERDQVEASLLQARQDYERLLVRLKVTNPEYTSLVSVEPPELAEIQATLAPNEALVSFFLTPARGHGWVLDREGLHHEVLTTKPAALSDRVRSVAGAIGRRLETVQGRSPLRLGSSPQPAVAPRADDERSGKVRSRVVGRAEVSSPEVGELYQQLIAPLEPHLQGKEKLTLVPHGALHYLPFAALRRETDGEADGPYLAEVYTLTLTPSAGVRRFLASKESDLTGRALVLGRPQEIDPRLAELPASGIEAVEVARLFGTTAHLGAEATESRLYALGDSIDLLHLAAHGSFDPENPRFSRLALAPGAGEDGYLEVHEIFSRLDLTGVNLVVLSACETALGKRSGGDDVVSVTRALLYAGTPGVLSTLWRIDDAATATLMTRFYHHLLAGRTAAEALRSAQLDFALGEAGSYRDPYFWAGFVLTGDPRARWGNLE